MSKLRLALRKLPDQRLIGEATPRGNGRPKAGVKSPKAGEVTDVITKGQEEDLIPFDTIWEHPETPAAPLKPTISRMPKRGLIASLTRRFFQRRELTEQELAYKSEMQARRLMERQLRDESNLYMNRIINMLNVRELCYRYPKSERDLLNSGIKSVRFDCVVMQPEAIYLRIDTKHLPRGVGVLKLMDPDILTDLSIGCGRKVTSEYREDIGAWYIVERATGVRGIPIHVRYQDMMETFPASADELTFPLGMGQNSKRLYRSLKDFPHLLIAGSTDSGKSNMMNVIIGTLVSRNSPDNLKLIMVDLKGGMEFTFYEGLPHLIALEGITETGIIYDREQVPDALDWLIWEGENRMELIKAAGHKNITKYNAHRRKGRLPRIVLVIDEWADVRLVRSVGTAAEDKLSNLASRMRAVGVHVIVATQSPKREVISTIIKTNLPAKMAFSCPHYTASNLILDNGDAKGLAPQGRFIYQKGDQVQIQAPYMPDNLIREIVGAAIEGRQLQIRSTHDVTLEEVLEWALDNLNGDLVIKRLFPQYQERGLTRAELQSWLTALDGQGVTIRENFYQVLPASGNAPRRLKVVTGAATNPGVQIEKPAG